MSGLVADARTMVDKARVEAQVLYMLKCNEYQFELYRTIGLHIMNKYQLRVSLSQLAI